MSGIEADVRKSTDGYFKNHSIVEVNRNGGFGNWRCSNNGSSNFSFTITVIPGSLILTGDLGNLIVTRHGTQMIPWCRGSVDDTTYFAEKTGQEFTRLEFSICEYRKWLVEQVAENTTSCSGRNDIAQHYQELLDNGVDFCTELEAYESLHADHEDDHEVGVFWKDWNRQFLVKRDAIRWFVMNYVEPTTEGGVV
jgi:hypothetical protein